MNIKSTIKYQLHEYKTTCIVYYAIMIAIIAVSGGMVIFGSNGMLQMNGLESSSIIVVFVIGLCSFTDSFHLLLQNNISRKTIFLGRIATIAISAVGISILNKICNSLYSLLAQQAEGLVFGSVIEMSYRKFMNKLTFLPALGTELLFNVALVLAFTMVGYFIAISFYRANKVGRIAIAAGLPVFFFGVLPIAMAMLANSDVIEKIVQLFLIAIGATTGNPFYCIFSLFIVFVVFGALSFLQIRKMQIRK